MSFVFLIFRFQLHCFCVENGKLDREYIIKSIKTYNFKNRFKLFSVWSHKSGIQKIFILLQSMIKQSWWVPFTVVPFANWKLKSINSLFWGKFKVNFCSELKNNRSQKSNKLLICNLQQNLANVKYKTALQSSIIFLIVPNINLV